MTNGFIQGTVTDKCIDHIAAILYMTNVLFPYGHQVYSEYNVDCNKEMEYQKFKNRKKGHMFTWIDAAKKVHEMYQNRFANAEEKACRQEEWMERRGYW